MKNDSFRKRADELCSMLTLKEKLFLICTRQQAVDKIGMKAFNIGSEAARGFVGRNSENYSTVFPQPIGLAGTFDKDLMLELGEIAGNEARAYYNSDSSISHFMWGPTVDMERHPLWGRTEEGYGEDVCLAGEMTRAYTYAMAADNGEFVKTIPTLKHFCANNNETDRGSCNIFLPPRLKYEYYYAAFMNAIKYGGAKSIMASYNGINGIPALCSPEIKSILKNEWGLWFAVTDGCDFSQNVLLHRYCGSHAETIAESLKAGCDVMNDEESLIYAAAENAVADGILTESDIDHAVRNVLFARLKSGELSESCSYNNISKDIIDSTESAEVCLCAAREQVVLLKNDGILPLKKIPRKIAVVGALADENLMDWYTGYFRRPVSAAEGIRREFPDSEIISDNLWDIVYIQASNGKYLSVHEDGVVIADANEISENELFELQDWGEGWLNLFSVRYKKYIAYKDDSLKLHNRIIYDWFTQETFNIRPVSGNTFVIEEYLGHRRLTCSGDGKLLFVPNQPVNNTDCFTLHTHSDGSERGLKIAAECDIIIYCIGNHPIQNAKECFDRKTLALNVQSGTAHKLAAQGKTVMTVISSYPYSICSENEDENISAILYTTHAGANLGTALAETISGKNNPAGRLAMTWYSSDLDLPDIMDYDIEKTGSTYMYFKGTPLYPFGYGLSYSSFEYKSLDISENPDGTLKAYITLKNTSEYDGDEVIQLYFSVRDSRVSRPLKKLCAFERVNIKAETEQTVRLTIKPHILQIYDVRRQKMISESGTYTFMAGGNSANLPISAELEISGEEIGMRGTEFEAQYFDSYSDIVIEWSRKLKRHYIRATQWSGTVIYGGISLAGKKAVRLSASSVSGSGTIIINDGKKTYTVSISPSMAYDDFKEYVVPVETSENSTIAVTIMENMCLLDISIL